MAHSNSINQQGKAIMASMDFDYWLCALMTLKPWPVHYFTQPQGKRNHISSPDSFFLVCWSRYVVWLGFCLNMCVISSEPSSHFFFCPKEYKESQVTQTWTEGPDWNRPRVTKTQAWMQSHMSGLTSAIHQWLLTFLLEILVWNQWCRCPESRSQLQSDHTP